MAHAYASSAEGLYRLPEDVEPREARYLRVAHAQKPLLLRTAPWRREVTLSPRQVLRLARRQAAANSQRLEPGVMARFVDRPDTDDHRVAKLRQPAGKVTVLSASTGVGKSVLLNAAAALLVRQDKGPVTAVVRPFADSEKTILSSRPGASASP
jgi:hypothetical protein